MHGLPLTAAVTLCVVTLMFWTSFRVGMARKRYAIRAPDVSGHPVFERAYRVQMNTIEWALMLLPCLWLAGLFVTDGLAAAIGMLGVAGRVHYALCYQRDPETRGAGFLAGAAAFGVLGLIAAGGIIYSLFQA